MHQAGRHAAEQIALDQRHARELVRQGLLPRPQGRRTAGEVDGVKRAVRHARAAHAVTRAIDHPRQQRVQVAPMQPLLGLPEPSPILAKLRERATHHPERFQACLTTIAPFLPAPTRKRLWSLHTPTLPSHLG